MPPVLDVTLYELARGGPQYLRACHVSLRHGERHHVLKLIAKAIGAAGLIKRRSRPDAASERLIEQPAVEHNVHSPIRCGHLNLAKNVIPVLHDRAQGPIKVSPAVERDQCSRFFRGRSRAEEKDDLGTAPRTQLHHRLQGTARVEAGADLSRESFPSFERCRMVECAVAAKKLRPITCPCGLAPAEVDKGYAATELAVPGVTCEHCPRFRVDLGDDEGRGGAPRNAEHPLDIRRHRETSGSA